MAYVDPRKKFALPQNPMNTQAIEGAFSQGPTVLPGTGDPNSAYGQAQASFNKVPETRTAAMSGHAGAAEIYDMLVNSLNQSSIKGQIGTDWLTQYKDKLIGSIIPAAQNAYGNAGIQNAFQNYWRKAILMAYSAATGKPFYDKTGDGSQANLLYIPGYGGYGPPTVNSDEAEYIV